MGSSLSADRMQPVLQTHPSPRARGRQPINSLEKPLGDCSLRIGLLWDVAAVWRVRPFGLGWAFAVVLAFRLPTTEGGCAVRAFAAVHELTNRSSVRQATYWRKAGLYEEDVDSTCGGIRARLCIELRSRAWPMDIGTARTVDSPLRALLLRRRVLHAG